MPDGIGHGQSSKPSDGLRTKFPLYDYADMVEAQHRLLTEGLGIKHLRLVMGNSMGGMQSWLWAGMYPDFMDAAVPMAAQPTPMAARNWMMRRLIIDTIRNDPDWNGGNYTTQPKSVQRAAVFFAIGDVGRHAGLCQKLAPTRAAADKMLDERLHAPCKADANDYLYQWESSGDYDPTPVLSRITATVLAINAADDERNPPETGLTEAAMKQVKDGRLYLIPASAETRGHGTTGNAKFYTKELAAFLQDLPGRALRLAMTIADMPLYTHLDRIERGLAAMGIAPGAAVRPEQLFALDQWHYHGTEAIAAAARTLGLTAASHVLDIGAGVGGPARFLAHTVGCHVTALELQPRAACAGCRADAPHRPRRQGHAPAGRRAHASLPMVDAVVSFLAIVHIPERPRLFAHLAGALRPGGGMLHRGSLPARAAVAQDRSDLQTSRARQHAHQPRRLCERSARRRLHRRGRHRPHARLGAVRRRAARRLARQPRRLCQRARRGRVGRAGAVLRHHRPPLRRRRPRRRTAGGGAGLANAAYPSTDYRGFGRTASRRSRR